MNVLQIEAGAEGGDEGRDRQKPNGERIGADMLQELARHQRAQRNPEQHQHRLGEDRRHGKRPSHHDGNADRHHGARDQPARQSRDKKQNAADRADRERLKGLKDVGAAFDGVGKNCAHAALWQIHGRGTIAPLPLIRMHAETGCAALCRRGITL